MNPHNRPQRTSTSASAAVAVLVLVLSVSLLAACTRPGRPPSSTTTTHPGTAGRYTDRVFASIQQIATGVTYTPANPTAGWPRDLKLDAWAPANDTATKRPAIVWAFGGGFVGGNRQAMNTYAQDSARRGYVGITIDYRLLQQPITDINHGIIPAYLDTVAAGHWLRTNATRYGIDPEAISVGGVSAGGMNAINAVTLPGAPLPALPTAWIPPGTVNATSTPYAAAIANSGAAAGPMGGTTSSRAGQGPIIMFAGTADTIVSYANWQVPTCNLHQSKGNVCELVTYQGASHTLPWQTQDLLNRSAAFVHRHVLAAKGY